MRLILVNNAHPQTPHVSGMRLYYFARAMSRRGHRVVLLTGAKPTGASRPENPASFAKRLLDHDWQQPFMLEIAPVTLKSLDAVRRQGLPGLLRRMVTAWHFLAHGGAFADWTQAVKPFLPELISAFKPDLVWATFGNTSNLALAQAAARLARCPWVMDIKDNWEAFVPAGLRRLMAWRFRDAAGLTANAEHHLGIARRWHQQPVSGVVYSGVADGFFHAPSLLLHSSKRYLLLVGSTYSMESLRDYLDGVSCWVKGLSPEQQAQFVLHYAGSDTARVTEAAREAGLDACVRTDMQLPLEELAKLAYGAFACSYLWASFGFHHKLLELLTVGRPVIVYPGEHEESLRLASSVETPFYVCADHVALDRSLQASWDLSKRNVPNRSVQPPWGWDDFAERLENIFITTINGMSAR